MIACESLGLGDVHLVTKMAFDLSQLQQDLAKKVNYELYYVTDDEAYAKLAFELASDQIPTLASETSPSSSHLKDVSVSSDSSVLSCSILLNSEAYQ